MRHPTTRTWTFPPDRAPDPARTNLKELAARPARFEHHLTVVAQLGCAQLEIATASEPVYFAHVNISDEYAVALPTGDPMIDAFPLRTFVADRTTGADVGRYNHRAADLVLHPHGYAHWPGKLRAPYAPIAFPPGTRRCVLSLVYCASEPMPSSAPALALPAGRKPDDVKPYVSPPPPLGIADLLRGAPGIVGRIGDTTLALVERPAQIAPPRGGWVVILAGTAPHAACDLRRLAPGEVLDGAGIERALVLAGDAEPGPIPPAWSEVPAPPFPPIEEASRIPLPLAIGGGGLRVTEVSPTTVAIHVPRVTPTTNPDVVHVESRGPAPEIPRYWLARLLYRVALHGLRLNYVETYGGFFIDDSGTDVELGLRYPDGRCSVTIPRARAQGAIERLYAAVAPPGYTERLE